MFFLASGLAPMAAAQGNPGRVIVVTLDRMRWQEIFDGANRSLITGTDGGVADTTGTLRQFWRDDAAARRQAMMPFLSGVIAERGILLGDSAAGSVMRIANDQRFSYPGDNELFTREPDPRIDSNNKIPNPSGARRPDHEEAPSAGRSPWRNRRVGP